MAKKEEAIEEQDTGEIVRETMTGDLRDIVLDIIRNQAKTWGELTEDEQRSLAQDVQTRCEYAVSKAVRIIAADGRPVIEGQLEQVTVKDGLKAVVKMSQHHALRHAVIDATGLAVLMVVSDSGEYTGERAPANVDPDQPSFIDNADDAPVADKGKATRGGEGSLQERLDRIEKKVGKSGKKDVA